MKAKWIVSAAVAAMLATAANAQTVGMGATQAGYTSQAGAAIAKLVSTKSKIQMRVQPSKGTSGYVPLIHEGSLEFGLANEYETRQAVPGTGIYEGRKHPNIRVATRLQPFISALYTKKDSSIKTVGDLKGKRVPSGWASQKIIGQLMNAVFANAGMSYDDVQKVPAANVVAGANDFAAGKTDAFFFAAGAGKVQETDAKVGGLRVIPIDPSPAAVARMQKVVPPAYPLAVKPGSGPSQLGVDKPMHVMAYDYLMLVNANVSDDVVYQIVKLMHENKADLVKTFPAMVAFEPDHMSKDIPGVQFHSGAIKYYKEIGQWPPKM